MPLEASVRFRVADEPRGQDKAGALVPSTALLPPSDSIPRRIRDEAIRKNRTTGERTCHRPRDERCARQRDRNAEKPEAQAPSRSSKSREQAMAALEMLKAGPVTAAQLKTLNEKYPSDPIYYVRTLLQQEVKTARIGGQTCYLLPEAFAIWQQGQKKE